MRFFLCLLSSLFLLTLESKAQTMPLRDLVKRMLLSWHEVGHTKFGVSNKIVARLIQHPKFAV